VYLELCLEKIGMLAWLAEAEVQKKGELVIKKNV
jgi:hypothetical protein